jgi:DnaJ-class molecular chaperone
MTECPECDGRGKKKIEYAEMNTSKKPPEYRIEECRLCNGNGEVSKLGLGVYKARGNKTAPKTAKGFS